MFPKFHHWKKQFHWNVWTWTKIILGIFRSTASASLISKSNYLGRTKRTNTHRPYRALGRLDARVCGHATSEQHSGRLADGLYICLSVCVCVLVCVVVCAVVEAVRTWKCGWSQACDYTPRTTHKPPPQTTLSMDKHQLDWTVYILRHQPSLFLFSRPNRYEKLSTKFSKFKRIKNTY